MISEWFCGSLIYCCLYPVADLFCVFMQVFRGLLQIRHLFKGVGSF